MTGLEVLCLAGFGVPLLVMLVLGLGYLYEWWRALRQDRSSRPHGQPRGFPPGAQSFARQRASQGLERGPRYFQSVGYHRAPVPRPPSTRPAPLEGNGTAILEPPRYLR